MSDPLPPELSFVIPAYREAKRLPHSLEELARFSGTAGGRLEVLIVVERSPDDTLAIARGFAGQHPGFVVIDHGGPFGKGRAVRTGMLRARAPLVFFMDADLSVPLADVPKFVQHFHAHPEFDVVIGDRQHPESDIAVHQSWLRERMGQSFNVLLRLLADVPWRDTQCGFKAFRLRAAREIFRRQTLDGFAFDVEVLMLAQRLGFRVETMPVRWINSPESKVRIVSDSVRMLRDAVKLRARDCRGGL
jgi:glycosyltransferase involved in cell wall biosynthesis